jgi:hypothetical protein
MYCVQVNGTLDPEVLELRKQIEKQSSDLGNATRTLTELRSKVTQCLDCVFKMDRSRACQVFVE